MPIAVLLFFQLRLSFDKYLLMMAEDPAEDFLRRKQVKEAADAAGSSGQRTPPSFRDFDSEDDDEPRQPKESTVRD